METRCGRKNSSAARSTKGRRTRPARCEDQVDELLEEQRRADRPPRAGRGRDRRPPASGRRESRSRKASSSVQFSRASGSPRAEDLVGADGTARIGERAHRVARARRRRRPAAARAPGRARKASSSSSVSRRPPPSARRRQVWPLETQNSLIAGSPG
jgi:hypothetical protein